MNGPGQHVFTRAALTGDQDGGIDQHRAPRGANCFRQGFRRTDDGFKAGAVLLAKHAQLTFLVTLVQNPAHENRYLFDIEWFN